MPDSNPYDALVGNAPQDATAAGYDDLIKSDQSQGLRQSMLPATQVNPDKFAQAKRAGTATGVPADVAYRNLPQVQQQAQLNSYDGLLDSSPKLVQALRSPTSRTSRTTTRACSRASRAS